MSLRPASAGEMLHPGTPSMRAWDAANWEWSHRHLEDGGSVMYRTELSGLT